MCRNSSPNDAWRSVLAAYPAAVQPLRVEYREGAGGFSGAEFWRLETSVGPLCLRRWPPDHPTPQRLMFIHQVLRHAATRGIDFLPLPTKTTRGETFVAHDDSLWELTPWLPGEADFDRQPRSERLCAALAALARLHLATVDFPSPDARIAPSPGVAARLAQLRAWTSTELAHLRSSLPLPLGESRGEGEIISLFTQLAPQIERELTSATALATRLQPVVRDVHAGNFLFTGDAVTGLVDFGAMNIDTPAADIARLLGSAAGDDDALWQFGLAAYEAHRPLTSAQRQLIPIFDRSTVALSGLNWLRWLYLEQRTFDSPERIAHRLNAIRQRMRAALPPAG